MQNVVCIINGMLHKMKIDEQNTPLNEMLICSICLTTDNQRYGVEVTKIINKVGGEIVFSGELSTLVIGDGELQWDMISIVQYPSVATFMSMTTSEEYQKIHFHREAGLEHQLLVQC
ncbi:MAG TPA: DUF1330 domain-containing protein [Gammaproteobacteria bacterium]|nr:DUF1330 domain-containing protein [Gammaproteobacteria bacterium]